MLDWDDSKEWIEKLFFASGYTLELVGW